MKSTAEYIREQMQAGKGVNLKGFGAFTFEVYSDISNLKFLLKISFIF